MFLPARVDRGRDGGVGRSLIEQLVLGRWRRLARRYAVGVHFVVVDLEPLVEAEPAPQRKRAHEGGRLVAGGREPLGERLALRWKSVDPVVARPVDRRREAGHDGRMRRQGDRRRRPAAAEAEPLVGEAIEVRGAGARMALDAQVVRPEVSRVTRTTFGRGGRRGIRTSASAPPPSSRAPARRRSFLNGESFPRRPG